MARNREILGTVLLVTGTLFTVAGAVALAAGYTVVGVVLLAIGLSDVAARFVLTRRPGGTDASRGAETRGAAEPGPESADASYNPYARED